jgi:hypothetical protein|tara:strand:+ start:1594 stop:2379 length:786 start_codon:yes stop_codon:yes gene_type:complete
MAVKANVNNFYSGAFLLSRSLFGSDIWFMPPEYLKIWIYLIGKANHAGRKYRGFYCERGQYFTTYQELLEQLDYKIGYRKIKKHEVLMKRLMKFLRETQRVTTTKKPRGVLVTISNYSDYQNLCNYEKTNRRTNKKTKSEPGKNQSDLSINKNYKELKNEKDISTIFNFWNEQKIIVHREIGPFKSHISARLKNYSADEITGAISNYSTILEGDEYFFSYKWGLDEFLSRKNGLDKFITANDPFNNFKSGKGKNEDKTRYC